MQNLSQENKVSSRAMNLHWTSASVEEMTALPVPKTRETTILLLLQEAAASVQKSMSCTCLPLCLFACRHHKLVLF